MSDAQIQALMVQYQIRPLVYSVTPGALIPDVGTSGLSGTFSADLRQLGLNDDEVSWVQQYRASSAKDGGAWFDNGIDKNLVFDVGSGNQGYFKVKPRVAVRAWFVDHKTPYQWWVWSWADDVIGQRARNAQIAADKAAAEQAVRDKAAAEQAAKTAADNLAAEAARRKAAADAAILQSGAPIPSTTTQPTAAPIRIPLPAQQQTGPSILTLGAIAAAFLLATGQVKI
jgi:hypothetical protein